MEMLAVGVTLILSMVVALAATGTILSAAISIFERTAATNRRAALVKNPSAQANLT